MAERDGSGARIEAVLGRDLIVTHHLQMEPFDHRVAICGVPNPPLDLRPFSGRITCVRCRDLWDYGYRGPYTKGFSTGTHQEAANARA